MGRYVALLRGINVGGNNVIPMKDLKATFEGLGFAAVRTYIQSGNVLFDSDAADPRALEVRVEKAVKKRHRCETPVVVRTAAELRKLVRSLPRSWQKPDPARRYYVLFLRHTIDDEAVLEQLVPAPDVETITYLGGALLWDASIRDLGRSKIARALTKKAIYAHVTVRNLNTTRKIEALLDA